VNHALTRILTPLWLAAAMLLLAAAVAMAGNKALLENWAKNKQQIKEKVYEQLQKEGKIPKNGSVYFEARTKKDPANPKNVLVEVDAIRVEEAGEKTTWRKAQAETEGPGMIHGGAVAVPETKPGKAADKPIHSAPTPIKPVDVTGYVRLGTLDIPVGEVVSDSLTIKDGKIAPDAPPATGKKNSKPGGPEIP
jgi:hypothetical protein